MLQGMGHMCIAVSDLDRSIAFYRDVVGCEVGPEMNFGEVVCVSLKVGNDTLELMKILETPTKYPQRSLAEGEVGTIHIGFQVDDIDEHVQRVKDSGAEVTTDLYDLTLPEGTVIRNFYFKDPDGYALQYSKVKEQ